MKYSWIRSLHRIAIIAGNTFTEAMRQKVLHVILLFAFVTIGSANLFTGFTFDEQLKFIKDFGFGAMTVFGTLIALLGAGQMIQSEIENRTIYTLLAKPVHRAEFLWGKFFGLLGVISAALGLMAVVFAGVFAWKGHQLVTNELAAFHGSAPDPATAQRVSDIHHQIADPQLLKVLVLLGMKIFLTAGIGLFMATFATSTLFTVATTLLVYLIGHWEGAARAVWLGNGDGTLWERIFTAIVSLLVPDFGAFGIVDDIITGTHVPWAQVAQLVLYGAVYLLVLLSVAQICFEQREL